MSGPGSDDPPPPWWPRPAVSTWLTDPSKNVEKLVDASDRRQDDLRRIQDAMHAQESAHLRELMQRDREYARELRKAEADRLDAIQARSDLTVQRAAEVQATQASALAAQVTATADAFRLTLSAALEPIMKDIRDLRDAQSRGVGGKEQVTESRDVTGASRGGLSTMAAVAGTVLAVIAVLISLYVATRH